MNLSINITFSPQFIFLRLRWSIHLHLVTLSCVSPKIQSTSFTAAYCFLIVTRGVSHPRTMLVDEACQLQEAVGGHRSVAWSWRMIWECLQKVIKPGFEGFQHVSILNMGWYDVENSGSSATEELVS